MKSCIYDDSWNIVAYADNADKMKDGSFICNQIKSCRFCNDNENEMNLNEDLADCGSK